MKVITKHGERELDNAFYVNPDGWFRETFALSIPSGNFAQTFIVEADHEQDALDAFIDSKFGDNIKVSQEDLNAAIVSFLIEEGHSQEDIAQFDSPWDVIHEMNWHENLFTYLSEECSYAQAGNGSDWYHSDLLMVGCLEKVKVEDYPYEEETEA